MRALAAALVALAATATALVAVRADTEPPAGTYSGKASEGATITVKVGHGAVQYVATHVLCGATESFVVAKGGARVRAMRFSLSGTGDEGETMRFEGRFQGDSMTGSIASAPKQASGCEGHAHFRAHRV